MREFKVRGAMRRAWRRALAGALCLALAGCATPSSYWHRPGGSAQEADADLSVCRRHFDRTPTNASYQPYTPAPLGVGGAVAAGAFAGVAAAIVAANNFSACMRTKGYELYAMTPEEQAKLRALDSAERERYFDALMADGGVNVQRGVTRADTDMENAALNCPMNRAPCIPAESIGAAPPDSNLWVQGNCPGNRQPC